MLKNSLALLVSFVACISICAVEAEVKPKYKTQIKFTHIMAMFRSMYYLGILGKERNQYWNLLLWPCFHRRELFPMAVTFTIYGYHFRKVSKLHVL